MNRYRTVKQLDPPEAAYIAGLVDGEGTVTLTTMHRGENRRLVDLPGYGFARVKPEVQSRWRRLLETYLRERESLVGLVITIDIRRGITELDDTLLRWLEPRGMPVAVLLTKADKVGRGAALEQRREVAKALGRSAKLTCFSALTRDGVAEARTWLADWLELTN